MRGSPACLVFKGGRNLGPVPRESTATSPGDQSGQEPADDFAFVGLSCALMSGRDAGKTTSLIEALPGDRRTARDPSLAAPGHVRP